MIENFNDFISIVAIAAILVVGLVAFIRYQVVSRSKDDDDDFYQEIL